MENAVAIEFKTQCIYQMEKNPERIKKCLDRITEEQVWQKPNDASNSIANLLLHLSGNIRQYAISSLGNREDKRVRDLEFSATGGLTKSELFEKFDSTVREAVGIIRDASIGDLLRVRRVQGFEYSGIGIVVHVTEHLSYHTGQIALITKLITNEDLGFYAGLNLNTTGNK